MSALGKPQRYYDYVRFGSSRVFTLYIHVHIYMYIYTCMSIYIYYIYKYTYNYIRIIYLCIGGCIVCVNVTTRLSVSEASPCIAETVI